MDFCWKSLGRLILNFSFKAGYLRDFLKIHIVVTYKERKLRRFTHSFVPSPLHCYLSGQKSFETQKYCRIKMSINHIFPLILVTGEVKNILIMVPKWTGNSIRFVSNLFELKINRILEQSSLVIWNDSNIDNLSLLYPSWYI